MDWELKRWKEIYVEQLRAAADDPETAAQLPDSFPSPFTADDAEEFISAQLLADETRCLSRAIIIGGKVAGCVSITAGEDIYARSAELRFWIAQKYRRCGTVSSAVEQLVSKAFEKLDIVRIYALPFAENIPARMVLNNCGFNLEGTLSRAACKNGVMHDCCVYALFSESE